MFWSNIRVAYDDKSDVLYVKYVASEIRVSKTEKDSFVIQNLDKNLKVVGLQLLYASDYKSVTSWGSHPDRDSIPIELFKAVEDWITCPL